MASYCNSCGKPDLVFSQEQSTSKMRTKGTGCLWSIGRLFLIVLTFGLWLIIGKRAATSHSEHNYRRYSICQSCGHKEYIDKKKK